MAAIAKFQMILKLFVNEEDCGIVLPYVTPFPFLSFKNPLSFLLVQLNMYIVHCLHFHVRKSANPFDVLLIS
jgi:hypothetical protein